MVLQEKSLVPTKCMLKYLEVKCHDVCNLLSNNSANSYIGGQIGDRKQNINN